MIMRRIFLLFSMITIITTSMECAFNVDPEPPAIPANFEAVSSDSRVELSWDFNKEPDFEGYNLYKANESISNLQDISPVNESIYVDSLFVDEEVSNGTTYYYRITAIDLNGNESAPSREIKVTPFTPPPTRP